MIKHEISCLIMIFACAAHSGAQSRTRADAKAQRELDQAVAEHRVRDWAEEPRSMVSPAVKTEIFQQMVRDREISQKCIGESGETAEIISVDFEDLNGDGSPEFFVLGKGQCTVGPRRPDAWYYRKTQQSYELMLHINQMDSVLRRKTLTSGYYDLDVTESVAADTFAGHIYKFDGRRYQKVNQRTRRRR